MRNHEIKEDRPLLSAEGLITEPGWSRRLALNYDRNQIKSPKWRIKEWDYYWLTDGKTVLAFTISDNGYMGLQSLTWIDLDKKVEHTESLLVPFPMGKLRMPSSTAGGDAFFENKRLMMSFKHLGDKRHITCTFKNFADGKDFSCDLMFAETQRDNLAIATPFAVGHKPFYYNQKMNGIKVSGQARLGDELVTFDPEKTFGALDWGRGVWTYNNVWKWGSGNGVVDGKRVAFNLGYGFGDTTAATENIIYYEGVGHKIDDVTFNFDEENYLAPWPLTSSDGRFEATFTPIFDRAALTNFVVLKSDQHQVFGTLDGTMILDDGTEIQLKDFVCFFERVHNKF